MLPAGSPRWRRRKDERPAEIVAAALAVFAAARLDDIAARAGISKGALYLYFETKEDLFRAVVTEAVAPNLDAVRALLETHDGELAPLVRMAVARMAGIIATSPAGGVLKVVIGESRNFPELAKVWHDRLVGPALAAMTAAIRRAQARGEVRPGDPRVHALSLISPMVVGVIWRETFQPVGAEPFDLAAIAAQHVETALNGMLTAEARP